MGGGGARGFVDVPILQGLDEMGPMDIRVLNYYKVDQIYRQAAKVQLQWKLDKCFVTEYGPGH